MPEIIISHEWVDKIMNLQENINRVKQVMGLMENSSIRMKDVLINRIPFLKEYNIFDHPRDPERLEAQRIVFNKDVTIMMKDEMVTFPQMNISSEVFYYPHVIDENTFHNFIIKNKIHAMPPDDMDDLTMKVLFYALNTVSEKISYSKEVMVKTGEDIPAEELDTIINDMNGCLFYVEDYTQKHNIDLF